ncbi:MAG TPA: SgcJ/EcaC family oxidoreductase [Candidatus Angelobacter sp.]|jgi:uncharacterized protein (TIGR02246 family)
MNASEPAQIHVLFCEAFNAGDVDALVALYEANAVLIVKGQPVTGLPAIRTAYQNILARRSRMALSTRSVVMFDESLAVLHGDWTVEGPAGEGGTARHGLSTEVVRRQADGSWKFVIDNPFTPR